VVVCGSVYVLRLAAQVMDPMGVGEFALVRRIQVFLSPLLMLGLFVGLPRSLGRLSRDPSRSASTVVAAWSIGTPAMALIVGLLICFPEVFARLLFGTGGSSRLMWPLILLLVGNQVFQLVFAEMRGRLQIRKANALMVVQVALLPPIVVILLGPRGAQTMLVGLGAATVAVSAVFACVYLRTVPRLACAGDVRASLRELCAYSLPRVPGDLAVSGLFALGPILAAHSLDLRAAGSLAIGMSLVTALSAGFAPIGLVLLPRLSLALSRTDESALRARLSLLMSMVSYGAAFTLIAGSALGNPWLRSVMGADYVFGSMTMTLLVAAAAANVVFVTLRSVLDAAYFRPLNAIHSCIALAALVFTWICCQRLASDQPLVSVCLAIAVGFGALAVLTLVAVARRFGMGLKPVAVARWIVVQGTLVGATMALERFTSATLTLVGVSLALVVVWLGAMRLFSVSWPAELQRYLVSTLRRAPAGRSAPRSPAQSPHGNSGTLSAGERDDGLEANTGTPVLVGPESHDMGPAERRKG
jgi:O-antigen/teichoic acid export membrane protein